MLMPDYMVEKLVKNKIVIIDPYFEEFQGPNCYHCHLGNKFLIPIPGQTSVDPLVEGVENIFRKVETLEPIIIPTKGFVLAETFEYFGVRKGFVIRLLNSSSLARIGVSQAALGMLNSGGGIKNPVKLTLELINNLPRPVKLTPTRINRDGTIRWGTEVLKVAVEKMYKEPRVSYDSWKYGVYASDQEVTYSKMAGRFSKADSVKLPSKSMAWRF